MSGELQACTETPDFPVAYLQPQLPSLPHSGQMALYCVDLQCVSAGQQTALTTVVEVERRCDYARLLFLLLELQCQAGCDGACLQPQHSEARPGELSL